MFENIFGKKPNKKEELKNNDNFEDEIETPKISLEEARERIEKEGEELIKKMEDDDWNDVILKEEKKD